MAARRWRVAIALLAGAAGAFAFAAQTACRDVPQVACISGGLRADDSTPQCGACLEDKCCDFVGSCSADKDCRDRFKTAQECVIQARDRAAADEASCLQGAKINADAGGTDIRAYSCMRDNCGQECGLPVCRVDPAAQQILSADCDQCITGACCAEINDCYQNRTCKLQLECLTAQCGVAFATLLAEAPGAMPGMGIDVTGSSAFAASTCRGEDASIPPVNASIQCLKEKCFAVYTDDTFVLDPSKSAACLGAKFFSCAAAARCAASCAPRAPAPDAGTDAEPDAAADAADAGDAD